MSDNEDNPGEIMPPQLATMSHPNCPNEPEACRITQVAYVQAPAMAWTPTYDGAGNLTNSDPNTFVVEFTCVTCGKTWQNTSLGGDTTFRDTTAG
jgi:hypothetical protein